jgi:thiol-disulfide isomerase/thioredoxin
MKIENYGNSELAKKFGVTRYPAIFIDDILVAKPKDFGFYGKGEGSGDGKYTPWKDEKQREHFRADLERMLDIVVSGKKESLRQEANAKQTSQSTELAAMPSFTLTDLSGAPISNKDLERRVVLVEFWATWCPPCRSTLSWLGTLQKQYGDRLTILAVAVESDEAEVRKVVNSLNLPIKWALGTPEFARSFGDIAAVPTLYLFDQKGSTQAIYYGAPPELHDTAEAAIKTALK